MSDKLNIGGRDVDTLTGFQKVYRDADGNSVKLATLNTWAEKAKKNGELSVALSVSGAFFYYVDELEKIPAYGRKAAAKMIHPDAHEVVVKDNVRLTAENVELESVIGLLNDRIDNLMKELSETRAVALMEYENV